MIISSKIAEFDKNHISNVYFEHYHIVTCILTVQIFTNLPTRTDSLSHFSLTRLLILYMEAIDHLLANSHQVYATGLKLLFQNVPKTSLNAVSVPSYEVDIPPIPILNLNKMSQNAGLNSFNHIQENVFTEVPEWFIGSDTENFSTKSRHSYATPIFPLDMRAHTISQQQETMNITPNLTAPMKFLYQKSTSVILSIGKSVMQPITRFRATKKKIAKLKAKRASPPILQFLYEKQEEAWIHPSTITLFSTPKTWRVGLYSLEHTVPVRYDNQPKTIEPQFKTNFTAPEAWCDLKHTLSNAGSKNLLISPLLTESSLDTHGQVWQVGNCPAQPMFKAPVVAYQYQPLSSPQMNQFKKKSPSSALCCILDAATRTWIQTSQPNPFGTLILLVFRFN
jgi:hypothetical protein